jgi:hypothetical protein
VVVLAFVELFVVILFVVALVGHKFVTVALVVFAGLV